MSPSKNSDIAKPLKKVFSTKVNIIIYLVSLIGAVPIIVILSVSLRVLINEDPISEDPSNVLVGSFIIGFIAIYTWLFFFLIVRLGMSLIIYVGSLIVVGPVLALLAFLLSLLITGGQGSSLFYWLLTGLMALYTWIFFYLIVPSFLDNLVSKSENLVKTRKKVRSNDSVKVTTLGLAWVLVGGFVGISIVMKGSYMLVGQMGWNENVAFLLIMIGGVLMLVTYSYFARRRILNKRLGRTVLWLRRFHQDDLFPFDLILEDICRGVALPLTVADTTVPNSKMTGYMHPITSVGIGMVLIAWMGGFASTAMYSLNQVASVAIPIILIGTILMFWGIRQGGRKDVRNNRDSKIIDKIFYAIDNQLPLTSNLTVLRLSDENWQQWVGAFIDRADSVIIDVTHLNDNLGWELNACRERLDPKRLVLACGNSNPLDEEPWSLLEPQLEKFLGTDFLSNCQRFNYRLPNKRNIIANLTSLPGFREWSAKYLRMRYEKALLTTFSTSFEAKDKAFE